MITIPIANPVMGDPLPASSAAPQPIPPPPPPPSPPPRRFTLIQPSSSKKKHKPAKAVRVFRNAFRSFPIITPVCKLPSLPGGLLPDGKHGGGGSRVTGTLFGCRKGRVSLVVQENPRTLPAVVLELGMQMQCLQKELSQGLLRVALECEKRPEKDRTSLMDEPVWTMFANGKKNGYGLKKEAMEDDLYVMEMLKAMSMGAGVLPPRTEVEGGGSGGGDGEITYMRWQFDRVVGSKDSETLYMLSPDHGEDFNVPDLSIFFVRV